MTLDELKGLPLLQTRAIATACENGAQSILTAKVVNTADKE